MQPFRKTPCNSQHYKYVHFTSTKLSLPHSRFTRTLATLIHSFSLNKKASYWSSRFIVKLLWAISLSLSRSLGSNLRHSPFSHQDTRKNRRWNELIGSCEKCEMNVETGRRAFAITAVKNTEYLWFIPTEFYLNFFVPFELEVSNQYFVADELRLCLSAKVNFRLGWLADSLSVIYLTLKTCFRHTTEFLDSHYSVL